MYEPISQQLFHTLETHQNSLQHHIRMCHPGRNATRREKGEQRSVVSTCNKIPFSDTVNLICTKVGQIPNRLSSNPDWISKWKYDKNSFASHANLHTLPVFIFSSSDTQPHSIIPHICHKSCHTAAASCNTEDCLHSLT